MNTGKQPPFARQTHYHNQSTIATHTPSCWQQAQLDNNNLHTSKQEAPQKQANEALKAVTAAPHTGCRRRRQQHLGVCLKQGEMMKGKVV